MNSSTKTVSDYHKQAKAIRNAKKAGVSNKVNAEVKENLNSLYQNAIKAQTKAGTHNMSNANKLQEMLRWSQGHWSYGAK